MAGQEATAKKPRGSLEQWASKLIGFSSQYDSHGWSAKSVLGQPTVYPLYGDIRGAWAQGMCADSEFIELGFETSVYLSSIHIYETFNGGGVKKVCVRTPGGTWDTVWETDAVEQVEQSRIFSPEIQTPKYRTNEIRLEVDCTESDSWVEIDAVMLVGRKLKIDPPPPLSELANDLATLVNDRNSSDVTFTVGDVDVYAHRAILAARSPTLGEMMKSAAELDAIPIDDMNVDVFLNVLHYLYSGNIPTASSPPLLVDVWRAGHRLGIEGLKLLCVAMIDESINEAHVVEVYVKSASEDPFAGDIQDVCLEYLARHLSQVSLNQDFKDLPQNIMLELVQNATSRMSLV